MRQRKAKPNRAGKEQQSKAEHDAHSGKAVAAGPARARARHKNPATMPQGSKRHARSR